MLHRHIALAALAAAGVAACSQDRAITGPAAATAARLAASAAAADGAPGAVYTLMNLTSRSEERRVGKECRARWVADDSKKRHQQFTLVASCVVQRHHVIHVGRM